MVTVLMVISIYGKFSLQVQRSFYLNFIGKDKIRGKNQRSIVGGIARDIKFSALGMVSFTKKRKKREKKKNT